MGLVWERVEVVNGRRCRGHCCRRFYLPFTPDEIVKMAAEGRGPKDMQTVANMIIPLHAGSAEGYWYTCCHHDLVSGNCLIYGTRPEMCWAYPYGNECGYPLCALRPWHERVLQVMDRVQAWLRPVDEMFFPDLMEQIKKEYEDSTCR